MQPKLQPSGGLRTALGRRSRHRRGDERQARQHLARLRLAGLVTPRMEGCRVIYKLRHGHLRRFVDEALNVADHRIGQLPPHD